MEWYEARGAYLEEPLARNNHMDLIVMSVTVSTVQCGHKIPSIPGIDYSNFPQAPAQGAGGPGR